MPGIVERGDKLYMDFRFKGKRIRESTNLSVTPANKKRLAATLAQIELQIKAGTFDFAYHFPNSPHAEYFRTIHQMEKRNASGGDTAFAVFTESWLTLKKLEWRHSQIETVNGMLDTHILPAFEDEQLSQITKKQILEFRLKLSQHKKQDGTGLSASRINHIMNCVRMILNDAADQFRFESPFRNIKPLPLERPEIEPFNLDEVYRIITAAPEDFKPYFTLRFFTGLRTGEIDGLRWKDIDFNNRTIHVEQALVRQRVEKVKTQSSRRAIQMTMAVYQALAAQEKLTRHRSDYVFCNSKGGPLAHKNVTRRVWYPLLEALKLKRRAPYQSRHTAATIWLASGESPEWIAKQLGHANTTMLFKVYSRYVPNLVRRDGTALERLLSEHKLPFETMGEALQELDYENV